VAITDANGCVTNDAITINKPALNAQLDRYVFIGLGTQDDQVGNNLVIVSGSVGHRGAAGKLAIGSNNLVNDFVAGNQVELGSNNAIGTLYRNTASMGSGNFIGTTITPVSIPLTAKVPCFPVFAGGPAISVPTNGSQTLVPGTYGTVNVGNGAVLNLQPGVYQFASLQTGNGATVQALGGAPDADKVMIFSNGHIQTGNNNVLYCSMYSKQEIQFGNLTGGLFRGSFIGGIKFQTGNNGQYHLDAYCWQNLAVCTNKGAGQEAQPQSTNLSVYPNPSEGQLTVVYSGALGQSLHMTVRDVLGRILYERQVNDFLGMTEQSLDLSNLSAGVYTVQVRNGETTSAAQFVITR
jgi:hypothetical protein